LFILLCISSNYRRLLQGVLQTNAKYLYLSNNKKSPRGIKPRRCSLPPPGGGKYVTVTQDKSPWLCSERHDEYFFGQAKTGGLGQVTTKKKPRKKKGITRPRPDGGLITAISRNTDRKGAAGLTKKGTGEAVNLAAPLRPVFLEIAAIIA